MIKLSSIAQGAQRSGRLGRRHLCRLQAAAFWLTLGNVAEARNELAQIPRDQQGHPAVLALADQVNAHVACLQRVIPDDVIVEPYWDKEA